MKNHRDANFRTSTLFFIRQAVETGEKAKGRLREQEKDGNGMKPRGRKDWAERLLRVPLWVTQKNERHEWRSFWLGLSFAQSLGAALRKGFSLLQWLGLLLLRQWHGGSSLFVGDWLVSIPALMTGWRVDESLCCHCEAQEEEEGGQGPSRWNWSGKRENGILDQCPSRERGPLCKGPLLCLFSPNLARGPGQRHRFSGSGGHSRAHLGAWRICSDQGRC